MNGWRAFHQPTLACAAALLAGLATFAAQHPSLRFEPGSRAWRHVVRGPTAKGLLVGEGGLLLPGLSRASIGEACVQAQPATRGAGRRTRAAAAGFTPAAEQAGSAGDPPGSLTKQSGAAGFTPAEERGGSGGDDAVPPGSIMSLRVDSGPPVELRVDAPGWHCLALPASALPGLRLDFAARDAAVKLTQIDVRPGATPLTLPFVAALLCAGLVLARPVASASLGLAGGALVAGAAWFPLGAWLGPQAWPALAPALALGLVGVGRAWHVARWRALADVALVAAFVFGAAVRLFFLHSSGSWDTEYWKAWMQRSVEAGVTQAYGPADALPAGHALRQLRGDEPLWQIERGGRAFVIDYPPLSMALWAASWHVVSWATPDLPLRERENVAVKLPALAGDVLSLVALAWACAPARRRALVLGALYWAAPVSWLSSATLGYFDGSLPPLLLIALVLAARGRAVGAGAWLAVAALIKPTALIAAPACALALWRSGITPEHARRALAGATLGGLAVSAAVSLPFALSGTLPTMVVHCARLFFQERLSGGYPNPWWLLGHVLTAGTSGTWLGPVAFAPLTLVPLPVRPIGTLLFGLGAVLLARRQGAGEREACRTGALLFLLYGLVGLGVHENHPHPLFLLLLCAGLCGTRARLVALGAALVYVGDMLALSGLGRFHGSRYLWLLPWAERAQALRMAAGIDLTLVLTFVHVAVFALAWAGSRDGRERGTLAGREGGRA